MNASQECIFLLNAMSLYSEAFDVLEENWTNYFAFSSFSGGSTATLV
jgi:hypothetical protein